jgi:hypothetical protein
MTDDELIKWVAQGYEEVEQKPVEWYRVGYPEKVIVDGVESLKYYGVAHDQLMQRWGKRSELRRLESLGFERTRDGGRWHVTFIRPIDSEAHAYFPPPLPEEDRERASTLEAVYAFVQLDRKYDVSEIVSALVQDGYESALIVEKIEKLVTEKSFKRLPDGRIINPTPF